MFKPKESSQSEYEFVSIDELVPDDHLLRLNIFQEIFDEIVLLTMNHKMVGERVLFTDSTYLKANASEQALLTAACQNIKKIVTHLARLEKVCCNTLN
ncbi:hypothetical protein V7150_04105 [Neobacillus drentensis]